MSCDNNNINQCTIQCDSEYMCSQRSLTCTTNSCIVLCTTNSACKQSKIEGKTATDLRVVCTDTASCKDANIECPTTGDCTIECHSKTSCKDTNIISNVSYNCSGYCAISVPSNIPTNTHTTTLNLAINDESIDDEPIPTIETHTTTITTEKPYVIITNYDDNLNVEEDMPTRSESISSYLAVIFISLLCVMCTNILYSIIKYLLNDCDNTIHLFNQLKDTENKLINWNQVNQQRTEKLIKFMENYNTNDQKTIEAEEFKQQYEEHEHKYEQEQKHSSDIYNTQTQTADLSFHGASHIDNGMTDKSNTNGSAINSNIITKQNTDTNDIGSVEGTKTNHEMNDKSNTIIKMTTDSQIIDVTNN